MRAVNLLTPELRSAPEGKGASGPAGPGTPGGIGAFVLLGALALIVAGLAGSVLSNNVIKDRKAELAQLSSRSEATVAKANNLKPYADFETVAKNRAGTVQALAAARFDWEQALRDISRAMPKDVFLSSLDGNVGGGAAARHGRRLTAPRRDPVARHRAQGLHEEPAGGRHADVADAHRAGRDAGDARQVRQGRGRRRPAGSTAPAAGAAGATANPCGKGSPPAFEMVIFFERSAVAQALSSATGAAGAGRHDRCCPRRLRPGELVPVHQPSTSSGRPAGRGHDRRYPVSRRNSILLAAVAAVALIAGYWMVVLSPKRDEAAKLNKSIATKQGEVQAAEAQLATYEKAKAGYKANYALVARLGKAVPADDDVRSLMVQLDAAAGKSKVDFRTIQVGGGAAAPAAAPAAGASGTPPATPAAPATTPPPGATPVGSAGFSSMPFTFAFRGSFFSLGEFFNRLDDFVAVNRQRLDVTGRLMVLNSISLAPDTTGSPQISAQIGASAYLLPAAQGLTAGASPVGPRHRRRRHPGGRFAAAGAQQLSPDHDRRHWSHPMTVFTDTWRFLVERKLWPVAILLVAAAAAVPFLLGKEPAAPAGPATASAVKSDEDSTLASEPIVAPAGDADRSDRRHVLGSPKNPFKPNATPTPEPTATPAQSGGGTVATVSGATGATGDAASAAGAPTAPSATPDAPGGTAGMPVSPGLTSPVTPVTPKKKTYELHELTVRFGAGGDTQPAAQGRQAPRRRCRPTRSPC